MNHWSFEIMYLCQMHLSTVASKLKEIFINGVCQFFIRTGSNIYGNVVVGGGGFFFI